MKPKRNLMKHFIDNISDNEISNIITAIANFFFACNIPLSVIESPHFKCMISKLRPSYVKFLPSRKVLSTKLLDESYNKCINDSAKAISRQSVLLIDGWKNTSNNSKNVVSIIHSAGANSCRAFLKAFDMTGISETGDKLSEIVNDSTDIAKQLYNTNIYAVVSDNAANMVKMGKNLEHVIWHSTCSSHTGNLLAKDVSNSSIAEKLNVVLREFKQSHLEKDIVDRHGHRIHLACETRWNSLRDACLSFIHNKNIMVQICLESQHKIKSDVKKLLFDDEFVDSIEKQIQVLDPVSKLINKCQSNECRLDEAAELWLKLQIKLNGISMYRKEIEIRQSMALNQYALTGYYLNPNMDKSILSFKHKHKINNFLLKNLSHNGLNSKYDFENQKGIFNTLNDKQIQKPEVYWSLAKETHPELADLASRLFGIPASSAQIERVFSNWAFVHSKSRNRLLFARSEKLVHVYYSIKNMNIELTDSSDNESDDASL